MSDYARLINSEKIYKYRINALTEENAKLKKQIEDLKYQVDPLILHEWEEAQESENTIDGEIVDENQLTIWEVDK